MSFTDEYLALRNKKKKKTDKETSTGHSFTDEYNAKRAVSQEKDDDIAPVPARKYVYVNKTAALSRAGSKNDIAPVTKATAKTTTEKEEEKDERKWFEKGAFEDGYQFGDVMKTILGTGTDVTENASAGIIGMGEKVVDALAYVAPLFAQGQFYQNGGAYQPVEVQQAFNESIATSKQGMSKFIAKDLYDEETIAKKIVLGTDANSVLGEKSDALVQSGGQLLATAGLQAVGVPWFVTTGATSFGSQAEVALNEGAGYEEAGASAAISAGAEILTEKLSGGIKFGGKTLDDVLLKPLTEKIASKTVKTLVNLGVDAAGEGFEEVLSGAISNLGTALYKEEDVSELLFSEEAMDEYIESFIGGAVLGGVGSAVHAVQDGKRIHLTENEQKVVEHEYEKRIADQDLTTKQKNDIRNEVIRDMERGYISTDTIEEVLGGEDYTRYQDTIKQEDGLAEQEKTLKEEFDALNQMKQSDMTGEQIDRRLELKEQLEELRTTIESTKNHSAKDVLKQRLGENVMSLVQNDRLAESYNERSRRGQAYQADLSKYDAKQQATIQKAIDSGILNNTNRTHEFVDLIAKITADKGVLFDFTNNANLKESGFALDGKTVNGYVTKDGVTLNIDSAKSLNSVVGHEITHVLEGTEMYTALQSVVTEYAKTKGEYQSRYDTLAKLYEGVEGADINAELTADLVGDYLFTDTDFVKHLSVTNRNVFQKIYDEIKYLCKVATAGSKELRELEKAKKVFSDVWRETATFSNDYAAVRNYMKEGDTAGEADNEPVKYSLSDSDGRQPESYAAITEKQQELYQRERSLDERKREANNNPELLQALDDYHNLFSEVRTLLPKRKDGTATQAELDRIEEIKSTKDEYLKRVADIQEALGLGAMEAEAREIRETKEALRVAADAAWEREGAERENKAIEKAGISAPEYFRRKALKAFKTTTNFNEAGYLLPDGKMLNFSGGERNHRHRDHREIGEIYEATNGVKALNRFLSDGNIRIMAESPGIDLASGVEPTREQYLAIRKFVNSHGTKDGKFFVDFSGEDGSRKGNYSYEGRVNADRVLNDIKHYYATGEIREQSDIGRFLSLSSVGEQPAPVNGRGTFGKDIALETAPVEEVAPVREEVVAENATTTEPMFPDDLAPIADDPERFDSLDDADAPPVRNMEYGERGNPVTMPKTTVNMIADNVRESLWVDDRQIGKVRSLVEEYGKQEFPDRNWLFRELKDNFGKHTEKMVDETTQEVKSVLRKYRLNVSDAIKGDIADYNDFRRRNFGKVLFSRQGMSVDSAYEELSSMYPSFFPADITNPTDQLLQIVNVANMSSTTEQSYELDDDTVWDVVDDIAEAVSDYQHIQMERDAGKPMPKEAFDDLVQNADTYAPSAAEDIAPVAKPAKSVPMEAPVAEKYEAIAPKKQTQPRMAKATPAEQASAQVLTEEPKVNRKKPTAWNLFKDNFIDKGTVFETLSLKTGNRELQAKWKSIGRAESSAQWFMEHGNAEASSLKSIRETVEKSGKTQQFSEYLYHMHNVDRMNLANRYPDMEDKPVFGYGVTSDMSKAEAAKLEKANPEFKEWANSVYSYMTTMREMMVDNGVISSETAKLWAEMYPHYVPIRRQGDEGLNINVALDTKRTGINAPIKKATGGNRNILPLFDTMALRTEQTFKAIARNRFGVELKNLLGTTIEQDAVSVDDAIDSVEGEQLQEGKDGRNPTFTVFENGEKVTFEITDEMYNTMKPKSDAMMYTNKVLNTANNIRRGLLTEYNPAFMLTNPIKDTQDVLINSQHPARTYANYPKAMAELWGKNGQYYQEYMEHGGEMNTYFDGETKTFAKEKSGFAKVIGFPLEKISQANNFIERIPRMAEYIASRKMGRSIDVSMLDAARVTTDFSAGGDLVKMANRNGFTFLNASVQGAAQQVRNVREAKHEGVKGWAKLAAKTVAAGLPAILLNHLFWDDDEDYEALSDYVKQNYYVVAKYGDGKFVRIPKGRALAVIQNGFEQMENLITGNDEVDFDAFAELVVSNLAPNNPLENNLLAPIMQAKKNTTWYGDDLVPTRLQDLPAAEQYDETTDILSKWLGEKLNISPYKINYVLDQYSGALGDTFLPMMTPEAERGNENWWGNLIAPISDKFTTDSVLKNQNVSDFYDKKDELAVKANADGATDEDVLMSKYMNSVNADLAKLYAAKRQIQNSDMPNAEKYEAVRDVQKQIVDLTKDALGSYDDISFESDYREGGEYARMQGKLYKLTESGEWSKLSAEQATKYEVTRAAGNASYATDGTNHYRWYVPGEDASGDAEPGWRKVTDKELERQKEVTSGLGISPETYWNNREEYSYAYDNPESYAVAKAVGGYDAYRGYSSELYDIKADKDENGKSISGSRKEKVQAYINDLDADYYTKIILWKSEYTSDDTYNQEIIDYLNGRDDISFEETIAILRKLGFDVTDDGDISW